MRAISGRADSLNLETGRCRRRIESDYEIAKESIPAKNSCNREGRRKTCRNIYHVRPDQQLDFVIKDFVARTANHATKHALGSLLYFHPKGFTYTGVEQTIRRP